MGIEMKEREKEILYWLCQMPGFSPLQISRLIEKAGSCEAAYYIEGMQLMEWGILHRQERAEQFDLWKREVGRLTEEYQGLSRLGIRFITPFEGEYPQRLLHIYDYPMGLYVKGRLPDENRPCAAVIGARVCTDYGKQMAYVVAQELTQNGVSVISGLAAGIDSAGHRGALKGNGPTFAVMGCGINICYPKENYELYEQIVNTGGVLSEYPPGTPPLARNFPVRNRIISGLSDVILVMEARKKSGSLITAELGLEQGKDIFALPGRINDPLSEGCNSLIEAGAGILLSPAEVLRNLGIVYKKEGLSTGKSGKGLAKNEKMVYSFLDSRPRHAEELAARTGLSISSAMSALLNLELEGFAVQVAGLYYTRKIEAD